MSTPRFDAAKTLTALFEEQVQRTPDAVAVQSDAETLTYKELNARANGWAERLVAKGVGPDVVVPLLGDRGVPLLTGMLAIMKAGGAYLPLDPKHPAERIAQVLRQVRTPVRVVSKKHRAVLDEAVAKAAVEGETLEMEGLPATGGANLPARSRPRNLAYVIFTSGSTGVPKGAMLEQLGMVNHLFVKVNDLLLDGTDVVAQTASQCFDISVWQFFSALVVGGKTVVVSDAVAGSPAALAKEVARSKISVLEVVPSLLSAAIDEDSDPLDRLKWLVATGEALPPELCRRWFSKHPSVPLVNAYGPTECSDDVTHHILREPPKGTLTPIGRAVTNASLYVLDESLQPVAPGTEGELFVGGLCVGRGYLGRADLTADRFLPDPFAKDGTRMYRTGDLVRADATGALEFLHRVDFQVKVRGFRIELGEIESALLTVPNVREAVVLAREEGDDKQLVAYVAPSDPAVPLVAENMKARLVSVLPEYMVPAAFVVLPRLPLTSNGKVDRKALPDPKRQGPKADAFIEPQTDVEKSVAQLWMKIKKLPRLGLHDSFFDSGANSLTLTQLSARISDRFEIDLAVGPIFDAPTVAGVAGLVEAALAEKRGAGPKDTAQPLSPFRVSPMPRTKEMTVVPLSFTEERHFRWWQVTDQPVVGRVQWMALEMEGAFNLGALEKTLATLQRRHELFRSVYVVEGQTMTRRVLPEGKVPFTVVDLQTNADPRAEALRLLDEELLRPFDLTREPAMKTVVYRLAPELLLLLFKVDHIAADGEGWRLLLSELTGIYRAYIEGTPVDEGRSTLQYADFALWQRQLFASGPLHDSEMAFWKARLENVKPVTQALPTDFPRAHVEEIRAKNYLRGFKMDRVELREPPGVAEPLEALARKHNATMSMVSLSAFAAALARRAQLSQVGISVLHDYRRRVTGLERVIGSFNNSEILRVSFAGDPTWSEVIGRAQREQNEIFSRPEFPLIPVVFPRLNDYFRVAFNFIGGGAAAPTDWGSCKARPFFRPELNQKFTTIWDLMFNAGDSGKVAVGGGNASSESGSLGGVLFFNGELWSRATIEALAADYLDILRQMASSPNTRVNNTATTAA